MAEAPRESTRMHSNLFLDIGRNLPTTSQDFKDFLTVTGALLSQRDIELNKESPEKILQALESEGYISIGDYKELKRILRDARLGQLLRMVEEKEKAIKEQLELENAEGKTSNLPSKPVSGTVSSPDMVKPNNELAGAITDLAKVTAEQDYDKVKDNLRDAGKVVIAEIEKVDVKSVVGEIGKWAK